MLYFYINPSDVNYLPKCPLFITTGLYCPGCGSQRATHHLLNLNFIGIVQQNVLYILGGFFIIYHLSVISINKLFRKTYYNVVYHPKTPIIVLIIVILFWILRNISVYPFNLLAPH